MNMNQNFRRPVRDSKMAPPEYQSEAKPLQPSYSDTVNDRWFLTPPVFHIRKIKFGRATLGFDLSGEIRRGHSDTSHVHLHSL
jgi:hypothetical protein